MYTQTHTIIPWTLGSMVIHTNTSSELYKQLENACPNENYLCLPENRDCWYVCVAVARAVVCDSLQMCVWYITVDTGVNLLTFSIHFGGWRFVLFRNIPPNEKCFQWIYASHCWYQYLLYRYGFVKSSVVFMDIHDIRKHRKRINCTYPRVKNKVITYCNCSKMRKVIC